MTLNINFAKNKGWNCPLPAPSWTTIGTVGTAGQMAAGHVLTAGSFPSAAVGANLSWYGLNALTDGSGNGRTLVNTPSVPLTGTDILGNTNSVYNFNGGSSHYLSSPDALFDPGDSDFTYGMWAYQTNWTTSNGFVCSQWNSDTNSRCFGIYTAADGIRIYGNSYGTSGGNLESIMATPSSGWIHLAVKYVASENKFYGYVNGILTSTLQLPAGLYQAAGNRDFRIASGRNTLYLTCWVDELFFAKYAFTDNDIAKIYARKYSHNQNITPVSQKWIFQAQNGSQTRELFDNIVDMQANDLYYDLSGEAATTQVSLRLANIY